MPNGKALGYYHRGDDFNFGDLVSDIASGESTSGQDLANIMREGH